MYEFFVWFCTIYRRDLDSGIHRGFWDNGITRTPWDTLGVLIVHIDVVHIKASDHVEGLLYKQGDSKLG